MKKTILSLALFSVVLAYSQEKQVKQAFLALDGQPISTVSSKIQEVDNMIGDKTYLLEPAIQEQYFIAKGVSLLKSGKIKEGAEILSKLSDLENNSIYKGKNADRKRVYFIGKEAAEASGISGLKEKKYELAHKSSVGAFVNPILQKLSNETIDAYNKKNYGKAGEGFQQVYHLLKAVGSDDKQYLYNSAISYAYDKNNVKAIEMFSKLIDSGYTGIQTTYTAKDNTTDQQVNVDKETWDLLKKNPQYSDFKSSTSPSIEEDLFDMNIALLIQEERYDEALKYTKKGLNKLPKSTKLLNQQGVIYGKLGKTDEFIKTLQIQLKSNPNDANSWFNLGVLYGKSDKNEESINAYKKAIEIDPKMDVAYLNLAYQLIGDDNKAIDEYNRLINSRGGKAKAEKIIEERRKRFEKALPYAEKLFELQRTSENAGLLKNIYRAVKNKVKYSEFDKLEAELSK